MCSWRWHCGNLSRTKNEKRIMSPYPAEMSILRYRHSNFKWLMAQLPYQAAIFIASFWALFNIGAVSVTVVRGFWGTRRTQLGFRSRWLLALNLVYYLWQMQRGYIFQHCQIQQCRKTSDQLGLFSIMQKLTISSKNRRNDSRSTSEDKAMAGSIAGFKIWIESGSGSEFFFF